jgi:hypothetical protein
MKYVQWRAHDRQAKWTQKPHLQLIFCKTLCTYYVCTLTRKLNMRTVSCELIYICCHGTRAILQLIKLMRKIYLIMEHEERIVCDPPHYSERNFFIKETPAWDFFAFFRKTVLCTAPLSRPKLVYLFICIPKGCADYSQQRSILMCIRKVFSISKIFRFKILEVQAKIFNTWRQRCGIKQIDTLKLSSLFECCLEFAGVNTSKYDLVVLAAAQSNIIT